MSQTPRILIVEADVLVRHQLAEYLRECGYKVAEACDATEALLLLQGRDELPIDILLAEGECAFRLGAWTRVNAPEIEAILTGSIARATQKAGELCEEGPAMTTPYEHRFVLERIRRLTAAREQRG